MKALLAISQIPLKAFLIVYIIKFYKESSPGFTFNLLILSEFK